MFRYFKTVVVILIFIPAKNTLKFLEVLPRLIRGNQIEYIGTEHKITYWKY